MRTNYPLQTRRKTGTKQIAFSAAVIFAAILFTLKIFAPDFSGNLIQIAALPFWKAGGYMSGLFEGVFTTLKSKNALENEVFTLREKIDSDRLKLFVAESALKENSELKAVLGRSASSSPTLAYVLSRPPHSVYDTFVIDAGTRHGVASGDKVLAFDFNFIGEVTDVWETTSKVKLYSSPGESISVIVGKDGFQAQATGKGNGNFEIQIPRDIAVSKGDVISAPDIGLEVYGIVEYMEVQPADSFQKVMFKSPINLNTLRKVLIKKK